MSTNNSALASLTATYTDSENEDENKSDDDSPKTDASTESQVIIPPPPKPETPPKQLPEHSTTTPPVQSTRPKKSLRLVSYNDDTVISDDENVSPNHDHNQMDISEEEAEIVEKVAEKESKEDKYAAYGFSLPPEPKGKCPVELQEKINSFYEKMKNHNLDMNRLIEERKDFRNPSIYEKLIQYCDIDELGTNYPPEVYDPKQWGKESYYEELAKSQKIEMDKREKERKENTKNELASLAAKKIEEKIEKRKSKWDQPGPSVTTVVSRPTVLTQPALTTSVTGTKGIVISAFGELPKKPKV